MESRSTLRLLEGAIARCDNWGAAERRKNLDMAAPRHLAIPGRLLDPSRGPAKDSGANGEPTGDDRWQPASTSAASRHSWRGSGGSAGPASGYAGSEGSVGRDAA